MAAMTARIRFEPSEIRDLATDATAAAAGEAELVLRGEALAEARKMADGIAGIVSLLRKSEGFMPHEPDTARLDEIAALFADIGDFATYGARTARHAADAIRLRRERERP